MKASTNTIDATLIVYDVPVGLPVNPPDFLRSFGFPINLSCWVVPTSRVSKVTAYFAKLDKRIRWETVHFDVMEKEKITGLAKIALNKEVGEIRKSMEKTIARAQAKIDELHAQFQDETQAKEIKKARDHAKGRVNHALKLLEKAEECALGFDLMADVEEAYEATANAISAYYQIYVVEKPVATVTVVEEVKVEAEERQEPITSEDVADAMGSLPRVEDHLDDLFAEIESITLSEEELAHVG